MCYLKVINYVFSFKSRYMKPQLQRNCTNSNYHIHLYLSLKFDNNMIFSIKYVEFLSSLFLHDMSIEEYLLDRILPCIICVIGSIHFFQKEKYRLYVCHHFSNGQWFLVGLYSFLSFSVSFLLISGSLLSLSFFPQFFFLFSLSLSYHFFL